MVSYGTVWTIPSGNELFNDSNCIVCDQNHSAIRYLADNNVPLSITRTNLATPEGKTRADKLELREIPALLIDTNTVEDPDLLISILDNGFNKPEGTLLYEQSFDGAKHIIRLVGQNTDPNLDQPIHLEIFKDMYSGLSAVTVPIEHTIVKRIDPNATYHYLPAGLTNELKNTLNADTVENAGRYWTCAQEQHAREVFENNFYSDYCFATPPTGLTYQNLQRCNESPHYAKPYDTNQLDAFIANPAGFNRTQFNACLTGADDQIKESLFQAQRYRVNLIPTAIINQTYKVHILDLPNVICALHPTSTVCA